MPDVPPEASRRFVMKEYPLVNPNGVKYDDGSIRIRLPRDAQVTLAGLHPQDESPFIAALVNETDARDDFGLVDGDEVYWHTFMLVRKGEAFENSEECFYMLVSAIHLPTERDEYGHVTSAETVYLYELVDIANDPRNVMFFQSYEDDEDDDMSGDVPSVGWLPRDRR